MPSTETTNRLFGAVHQYPWVVPPPGFMPIDRGRAAVVAAAGDTRLERIESPGSNYEGWIVLAGVFASSYTGFYFQFRQSNAPLRDYTYINAPLGQADKMDPIYLQLKPNAPLDLVANYAGGGPIGVRYRLFGWWYPAKNGGAK